jgi:hypothetical protein
MTASSIANQQSTSQPTWHFLQQYLCKQRYPKGNTAKTSISVNWRKPRESSEQTVIPWDLNPASPKYEAGMPSTWSWRVKIIV